MAALKQRQQKVAQALRQLGGRATVRDIAYEAGMQSRGVSQVLEAMYTWTHLQVTVRKTGQGVYYDTVWEMVDKA